MFMVKHEFSMMFYPNDLVSIRVHHNTKRAKIVESINRDTQDTALNTKIFYIELGTNIHFSIQLGFYRFHFTVSV